MPCHTVCFIWSMKKPGSFSGLSIPCSILVLKEWEFSWLHPAAIFWQAVNPSDLTSHLWFPGEFFNNAAKLEAVSRGINNYQEHHKLTDARKAQLNTRGQTTEFLPTNQAEDQVLPLLYSSTLTSYPVILVHYKACKDFCTGLRDYHNLCTHGTVSAAPVSTGSSSTCNPATFVHSTAVPV